MTAVIGLGGGVALMLVMPGLMPLAAIIPVHAFVQFVSNAARVGFAFHHVDFRLLLPLICGSVLGAAIGSQAVGVVSFAVLPAIAGIIIVLVVWLPNDRFIPKGRAALFALGAYKTGLGMVAGATGPLGAAVLNRINREREWLVVNTGVYMTINHGISTRQSARSVPTQSNEADLCMYDHSQQCPTFTEPSYSLKYRLRRWQEL